MSNNNIYKIHYLDENLKVSIESEDTILDTSLKNKINHQHVCGGIARCSSCRVLVSEGLENCLPRNEKELEVAKNIKLNANIRLACQTKVFGDVTISKPQFDKLDIKLAVLAIKEGEKYRSGEEKELTMLFLDIESFTSLVENMPAFDIVHFLNRFFYLMGNIVDKHHAKIIDYYGDGFFCVFGLDKPDSKQRDSVQAGLEIFDTIKKVGKSTGKFSYPQLNIRIGIKTGKVLVGTIGSEKLRKFSVMGDAVNTASRIESMNKELKTQLLVCNETYNKISEEFEFGKMYEVSLKGKSGKHKIWEVKL